MFFRKRTTSTIFRQWQPAPVRPAPTRPARPAPPARAAIPNSPSASPRTARATEPLTWRSFLLRGWLVLAVLWLTLYVGFRIHYVNLTPALAVFSVLVCFAEMHILLHLYGMLYSLWPRRYQRWDALNRDRNLRCNLFICVCGEPPEVVRQTILAALETARVYSRTIDPKHAPRVIVLNDGRVAGKDNWRAVEAICAELGAEHIARETPGGFKAGNINNGLRMTRTDDPHNTLDIVFDSDFCAKPEFLVEITKPFADDGIDFVQSPQRYKNEDTWVAKAAAAHQIFFFNWICPAKGHDNALFLCGTNFAIRRAALDAIGGIDERFITEDYATSLELHLTGHRGVFMPKVLALGMAPTSLKQYFTQQKRWSKGNFDVTGAYFKQLMFGPLSWKQKMHYMLSATYYLIGLRDLTLMLAPLPYLYLGQSLIRPNSLEFILYIYAPLFLANTAMYLRMFRFPIKSLVLDLISFPIFTAALFGAIFKQKLGFVVTIKKYEKENPLGVYKPQIVVGVLLLCGLAYSLQFRPFNGFGSLINYWWAGFNATFLSVGFYMLIVENAHWRVWEAAAGRSERGGLFWRALQGGRLPGRMAWVPLGMVILGLSFTGWAWATKNPSLLYAAHALMPDRQPLTDETFKPKPLMPAPAATRKQIFYSVPVAPQEKVIALTFDDGPYPPYTYQILDVLEKEKVKATFYMMGSRVKKHPGAARAVNAAGHDIGNHSWSHAAKPEHPDAEIWQTDRIIEKAVGVIPTHFRPPMGIMDNGMVQQARRLNHTILLWSCDPRDWAGTSTEEIVKIVVGQARPGGVVLMHDGGGDRSQTVRALPIIIRQLREQGYRFVSVPQLLQLRQD